MKIAVYTALYGDKDELMPPLGFSDKDEISYYVFSDKAIEIKPYKTIIRPIQFADIAKNARYFKILNDSILDSYDILIWHDANIQIRHNKIIDLITHAQNTYITTFIHPDRDCFYSEAMTCIRVQKDLPLKILYQAIVYFFTGMPAHNGMYSTGILIKNNKYKIPNLLNFWWKQTLTYSRRDQLSLAFTLYIFKNNVNTITDNIFKNEFSIYHNHLYNYYITKSKTINFNGYFFRQISFYSVKILRKLSKLIK